MRWLMVAMSLCILSVEAGERARPKSDTSRDRTEVTERPGAGFSIQGTPGAQHRGMAPSDPAVDAYWSDGCRREREFGYTTSPNCHHPAYTGDGYGPRRGPPWGPWGDGGGWSGPGWGPDTVIINRGGTVIVPRGGVEQPIQRGGALGGYRRR
jgi:hypothetical protein